MELSNYSENAKVKFVSDKEVFIANLLENLESRFPSDATSVLSAFEIFRPENVPTSRSQLANYGVHQLQTLLDFYAAEGPRGKSFVPANCPDFVGTVPTLTKIKNNVLPYVPIFDKFFL